MFMHKYTRVQTYMLYSLYMSTASQYVVFMHIIIAYY